MAGLLEGAPQLVWAFCPTVRPGTLGRADRSSLTGPMQAWALSGDCTAAGVCVSPAMHGMTECCVVMGALCGRSHLCSKGLLPLLIARPKEPCIWLWQQRRSMANEEIAVPWRKGLAHTSSAMRLISEKSTFRFPPPDVGGGNGGPAQGPPFYVV